LCVKTGQLRIELIKLKVVSSTWSDAKQEGLYIALEELFQV
jgi:hypothetical protein